MFILQEHAFSTLKFQTLYYFKNDVYQTLGYIHF